MVNIHPKLLKQISFLSATVTVSVTIQILLQSWGVMADQLKQRGKTEQQWDKGRKICSG